PELRPLGHRSRAENFAGFFAPLLGDQHPRVASLEHRAKCFVELTPRQSSIAELGHQSKQRFAVIPFRYSNVDRLDVGFSVRQITTRDSAATPSRKASTRRDLALLLRALRLLQEQRPRPCSAPWL